MWVHRGLDGKCGVRSMENEKYGKCGVGKVRSRENAEYGKCGEGNCLQYQNREWKARREALLKEQSSNIFPKTQLI